MRDYKFAEEGNIRVYEYPNGAEIVNLSEKFDNGDGVDLFLQVTFVKTKEEAKCIVESLTRFIESFNCE